MFALTNLTADTLLECLILTENRKLKWRSYQYFSSRH